MEVLNRPKGHAWRRELWRFAAGKRSVCLQRVTREERARRESLESLRGLTVAGSGKLDLGVTGVTEAIPRESALETALRPNRC